MLRSPGGSSKPSNTPKPSPRRLRGKPEAILAAMLLGRDWHLGPFEALRQIDVIEGTLSPGAELLLRLVPAGRPHPRSPPGRQRRRHPHAANEATPANASKSSYMLEDAVQAGLITTQRQR